MKWASLSMPGKDYSIISKLSNPEGMKIDSWFTVSGLILSLKLYNKCKIYSYKLSKFVNYLTDV